MLVVKLLALALVLSAGALFAGNEKNAAIARIATTCSVKGEDTFYGFDRVTFDFKGHEAWIVFPKDVPAKGNPWTWCMQWATAFVPRTNVPKLLENGYHHVTIDTFRHHMDAEGIRVSAAFQKFLVDELGFAPPPSYEFRKSAEAKPFDRSLLNEEGGFQYLQQAYELRAAAHSAGQGPDDGSLRDDRPFGQADRLVQA